MGEGGGSESRDLMQLRSEISGFGERCLRRRRVRVFGSEKNVGVGEDEAIFDTCTY